MTYRVKKLIAFFLTLIMMVNVMPVSVLSEGDINDEENDPIIEVLSKEDKKPNLFMPNGAKGSGDRGSSSNTHEITIHLEEGYEPTNLYVVIQQDGISGIDQWNNAYENKSQFYIEKVESDGQIISALAHANDFKVSVNNNALSGTYDDQKDCTVFLARDSGNGELFVERLCNQYNLNFYNPPSGKVDEKSYTITTDNSNHTTIIDIGEVTSYTYNSVRVEFYNAWSEDVNDEVSFEYYSIKATVNNEIKQSYVNNGKVFSFTEGLDLTSAASDWQFVNGQNEEVDGIEGYVIDEENITTEIVPGTTTKRYVIPLREPKTYSAELKFYNASGTEIDSVDLKNTSTVTAIAKNSSASYTATIESKQYLNSVENILDFGSLSLPEISSFTFSPTKVNDFDNTYILSQAALTESELTARQGKYLIKATALVNCRVKITSAEGLDADYDYYIVASESGEPVGYASFTTGNPVSFTLTDGNNINNTTKFYDH